MPMVCLLDELDFYFGAIFELSITKMENPKAITTTGRIFGNTARLKVSQRGNCPGDQSHSPELVPLAGGSGIVATV